MPRARLAWLVWCALPGAAAAQTFPSDDAYTPLPCGDEPMTDRYMDESGAINEKDIVGDVDHPAGYRAVDANFLFLRMRLDDDPIPGALLNSAWGMEIDTDGDRTDYEILALVDGVGANVLLYRNTTTTVPNSPTDPADEPPAATYPTSSHARSSSASGTTNGGDADSFLSFALAWNDLIALGADRDTPVYVWAASSSSPNLLNGDFACHDGASGDPTLSGIDNDRTVLDDDVDSDGDGASDAEEIEDGTDPNDPESRPGGLAFAGGGGCSCRAAPRSGAGAHLLLLALVALVALPATLRRRRRSKPL